MKKQMRKTMINVTSSKSTAETIEELKRDFKKGKITSKQYSEILSFLETLLVLHLETEKTKVDNND